MQFFFSKTPFLTSPKICKNAILAQCDTICVFKNTPTIKWGKAVKKNLDQFLTLDLDQFLRLETPNLGPVFNSTAYIYIYTFIFFKCGEVIIWAKFGHFRCYYLGQVGVIIRAKFVFILFYSGFRRFLC